MGGIVLANYVIVGAGSAGCALAGRLTEDPSVEVTLIEAGGPDNAQEIHIPIALGQLFKSQYDHEPARAGARRPIRLPAARKNPRRLQFAECDGLHSRP